MRKLMRITGITTLLMLSSLTQGQQPPQGTIYFLNVPETIRKSGVVNEQKIQDSGRSRIFWHYRNGTGKTQQFTLQVSEKTVGLRMGQGVSFSPPTAGTQAMMRFLQSSPRSEAYLKTSVSVPKGYTVSGVAEGHWKTGAIIKASLGKGAPVPGIEKIVSPYLFVDNCVTLTSNQAAHLKVGQNKPGHIPGNYGSTVRVSVQSKLPKRIKIRVAFSPRGGPLNLVYIYNGKIACSPRIAAKKEHTLFHAWVDPGQKISLDIYPLGGFNYPAEIRFTPER